MRKNEINSNLSQITDLLSQLVAINSVFPREQEIVNFVEQYLQKRSFEVERVPAEAGRDCLTAVYGQSENYICLYGHLDTVAPAVDWSEAFSVHIATGIARGLGVADMKGGIALMLLAADFAQETNLPLKLAFGVDEENISLGSQKLVETDFFADVQLLISAESGQVLDKNQDFSVTYGRKGRVVFEVEVQGLAAHAARSDQAINAISQSARLISLLEELQFASHAHLGPVEIIPFYMHSSTDSFSIPSSALVRLNVLTVPGISSQQVMREIKRVCKQEKINAVVFIAPRSTPYMDAYEVDASARLITTIEKKVFADYSITPTYAASVADENRFASALSIPVISIGPVGGGDHTPNEWVSITSLESTLEAYKKILSLTITSA